MRKFLQVIALCSLIFVYGCETVTKVLDLPVPRAPLSLDNPPPVSLDNPHWLVVDEKNFPSVLESLKKNDPNAVLFALSPSDFKSEGLNEKKIEQFIIQQRQVTDSYRKYYESEPVKK